MMNITMVLKKIFKRICSEEFFFKNLASHQSYPSFGTIKDWKKVCKKVVANKINGFDLIRQNFTIKSLSPNHGLLTGYYEPEIKVSKIKTSKYTIPILKYNKKFLNIKRHSIIKKFHKNDVLLWTNDIIDFFFLQIQGSGIGVFENGDKIKIQYDGNNNLKYTSIGKVLIEKKLLPKGNVNLFTIKEFLRKNPDKIRNILNQNQRYIFFKIKATNISQPVGALGINLIPNVSIAVDRKFYPLGIPILYKEVEGRNSYKLAFAMDTGSAIKGENRADLFTGKGKAAEKVAGMLKKKLLLYVLVPYSD